MSATKYRPRAYLLLVLVVVLIVVACLVPMDAWIDTLGDRTMWRGPSGVVLFVLTYVIWNFALPPAPVQALAGAYYGLGGGLGVILVSTTLANVVSHVIGRWLGRGFVAAKVKQSRRLAAVERAVQTMGWKGIALLRLSNLIPSNIANLLMGATALPLRTILWASILGSLPGWVLMLALGRGGRAVFEGRGMDAVQAVVYIVSAAAALALMVGMGAYARRIFRECDDELSA